MSSHSETKIEVEDKGVQCDSHEVVKVFASVRVQSDDCLYSCDSFKGMVPYRKPSIQDVQMYQSPKNLIQSCQVQVVKNEVVLEFKTSKSKKMKKKKKKEKEDQNQENLGFLSKILQMLF